MSLSGRHGAATILLVEDNEDDVFLTLRALKRIGVDAEVVVARDGVEAVEHLSLEDDGNQGHSGTGLILLDLKLPRMNGVEVLNWLRSREKVRHIPVVIVSSSKEELEQLQLDERNAGETGGISRNVIDYVPKSLSYEEFCQRLEIVKRAIRR